MKWLRPPLRATIVALLLALTALITSDSPLLRHAPQGRTVVLADSLLLGADGKSFEQRRADWLARDGKFTSDYYFWSPHDSGARFHVFAWLESGTHATCRQNLQSLYVHDAGRCYSEDGIQVCTDGTNLVERMDSDVDDPNNGSASADLLCVSGNIPELNGGPEWYQTRRWYKSGSHGSLTLVRMLYQYGDRLNASDRELISRALAGNVPGEYFFAGYPLKGDLQPQQWVIRFLYSIGDKNLRVKYCPEASPMCQAFTYRGKTYNPGVEYNSYELSRDALFLFLDDLLKPGYRYELDSKTYTSAGIESFMLLYDFADRTGDPEGVLMKQKAKMILDLLQADAVMEFSGNQHGGVMGRTYRRDYINGRDTYGYYFPWGLWYDRFGSAAFASSYRLSDPLVDLGVLNDEPDSYWHEAYEAGGTSWTRNKLPFVAKSYNLGSSRSDSRGWVATLEGNDRTWGQPFVFWINDVPGDLDEAACNDDECYTTGGQQGYQYRNALLLNVANPILHLARGGNDFDQGADQLTPITGSVCRNSQRACNANSDCNVASDPRDVCLAGPFKNDFGLGRGGWSYFQEGKTMLAIQMDRGSSWQAVEFATEGVEYPNFAAFQAASRSVSDGRFTTGQGAVIEARNGETYVNGTPLWSGGFPRIAAMDSNGNSVITWSDNVMTVEKNGRACRYDFNQWTLEGDGCGGSQPPTGSFGDVPATHWAYSYIEALFQGGFVTGCQTSPRRYCGENGMTRGEAAVFVERGLHGGGFLPPQPNLGTFDDVPLLEWFAKWAEALWKDSYTAGCGLGPLRFCPLQVHTRAEATVFFERMLHGKEFLPAEISVPPYSDVARGTWYAKWVAAAKQDGLTEPCEAPAERGDARFRPEEQLTRAEAACMLAKAKQLGLP